MLRWVNARLAVRPSHRMPASAFFALVYLTTPLFIFSPATLRWQFVAISSACILIGIFFAARETDWRFKFSWPDLSLLVVAALWSVVAGTTPLFYQNSDWAKHFAIFNLLLQQPWPPIFDGQYLRYSLGYYIVPALLAKPLGFAALEWIIGLWTSIGVWLVFLVATHDMTTRRKFLFVFIFILFGGMDYIGTTITGVQAGPAYHYEWWSTFIQIPSNTTSLFWAPQHALSAWLAIALALRSWSVKYVGLIATSAFFWSPFVPAGLLPFALYMAYRNQDAVFSLPNFAAVPLLLIVGSYLQTDTAAVPVSFIWNIPNIGLGSFLRFNLLEWGLLAIALWYAGVNRSLLLISAATLLAFTLVWAGNQNDLTMRATAPAIFVLSMLLAFEAKGPGAAVAYLVFMLGVPTALGEIVRSLQFQRPDFRQSQLDSTEIAPVAYQYLSSKPFVFR